MPAENHAHQRVWKPLPEPCSVGAEAFFRERLGPRLTVINDSTTRTPDVWTTLQISEHGDQQRLDQLLRDPDKAASTRCFRLSSGATLIATPLGPSAHPLLVAVINAGESLARQLVNSTVESWSLRSEVQAAQVALDESAMQLAQSFEEQNWLRGFAQHETNISQVSDVNDVASGILEPLLFLLRAEEVVLIVDPEETHRSGLMSTKYGGSGYAIETISDWVRSVGFGRESKPLVHNHLNVETAEGQLRSLVAVGISGADRYLGYLVAFNRSADVHPGLPIYDPEFGSSDVGLLEEAGVLLATQAQNRYLLAQSNQLFLGTLHAMSSAIDARDKYTQGHSVRVARLAHDLGRILGLSDASCQEIYLAGVLHDIGKIGVPDAVLLKPGRLTNEEFAIIRKHPEIGYRIVQQLGPLQFVLPGVLHHHERWDGRGYPHGLSGASIPLMARIMAVADAFDAMTSSRPYRNAMPIAKAHGIIQSGSQEQWDGEIVACFNQWLKDQQLVPSPTVNGQSIIPQGSPLEYMTQAVTTLIQ